MPPAPPLDDLEELDDLDAPVAMPDTTARRSERGPLIVLYGTLLVLIGLVTAGHFLADPRLSLIGFSLLAAVMLWLLLLWPLGSMTAATAWRFALGGFLGLALWYLACRFLLPQMSAGSDVRDVFLKGGSVVVVVGGLMGWFVLRRLRARL